MIILIIILVIAFGIYQAAKFQKQGKSFFTGYSSQYNSEEETINSMPLYNRKSDENIQMIYAFLAGWIIKKNSSDSKRKVDFVRQYFKTHFSVVHISSTESIVDGLKNETNVRSIAKWILSKLNKPEERIQIIDFLFEIVKIDGAIIDREFVAIVRFAELIGVKASYIDKKMQEFQEENFKRYQSSTANKPSKRTHALFVLHLSEGFTSEQLKRSYRKLAVKYHPDKQTTATESEKEIAQQKFIEIQEAYDFLSK